MAQLKRDNRTRKQKQTAFLAKLEEVANVTIACKRTKIPRRTIYNWAETDELFKVEYEKSVKIAIELLKDEAKRRAFQGVKEPVYHNGQRVGAVIKYSDTLLIFLLKCLGGDEFKTTVRNEHSAPGGGPVETVSTTTVISNVDYTKLPTSALEAILAARIKPQD